MLNAVSLNAVKSAKFSQRFVKPLYGSYCFSNIPQTIESLLSGQRQCALPIDVFGHLPTKYSKVILFLVDAFGWRFFERYADKYELLKIVLRDGVVSKLTSQFPSTTAAHVTCIHTGLDVAQSGVYEWNYYEPLVDEMISPLLFSYAGDKIRDTLKASSLPPAAFYPPSTFYQLLQARGITSYVFQSSVFTPSTYSNIVFRGAQVVPFRTVPEAFIALSELVLSEKASPGYYCLYLDQIDYIGHHYGPNSSQFEKEVDTFLRAMDQLLYRRIAGKSSDTLLMMTADHGQIEVDPTKTYFLNLHDATISRYLRTNRKGNVLVAAGSARDMFLYVKDECIDDFIALLQKQLVGRAEVYRTQDLLAQGFFGPHTPSSAFLGRLGNIVILPYAYETVWWFEEGRFDMRFLGHHGGLTYQEMEIPLLLLAL
jgi:predicted AlkP superfamily pyrophosphatase or phosphodiesterase